MVNENKLKTEMRNTTGGMIKWRDSRLEQHLRMRRSTTVKWRTNFSSNVFKLGRDIGKPSFGQSQHFHLIEIGYHNNIK